MKHLHAPLPRPSMCQECAIHLIGALIRTIKNSFAKHGEFMVTVPPLNSCNLTALTEKIHHCKPRRCLLEFPSRSKARDKTTALTVKVLSLLLDNMSLGIRVTTRDIYYQDVELFANQKAVSRVIERICYAMGITRSLLNVIPSPSGLVIGDMVVDLLEHDSTPAQISLIRSNGPALVPNGRQINRIQISAPTRYILVLEKEAVFSNIHKFLPEAILITGKGFPDHSTRKFLYALHCYYPRLPIYGLVDSDVYGLQILRTYQVSTPRALEFQFSLEAVQFLGIEILEYKEGLVDICLRERKAIVKMFSQQWLIDESHSTWRRELQLQIFMGKKAEMNILDRKNVQRLAGYVRAKIEALRPLTTLHV